jgi:membrane protein YqaA with SNARE-associated domain
MTEIPETRSEPRGTSFWTGRLFRLFVVCLVLGISLAIYAFRERFAAWARVGYPGIFVVSLLGNATVILPAPSLALVFAMGSALSPLLVGLTAGVGEALGELTGYAAGFGGRAVIENQQLYARLEAWMQRAGGVTVFLLSVLPNPFFDLAGIAAGGLRYPLWRFLVLCWLGKTIKTIVVAFLGSQSVSVIEQWLR